MGVPNFMKEFEGFEDLLEKRLYHAEGKTLKLVHLQHLKQRLPQRLKYQAVVIFMIEGLNITNDAMLIIWIPSINVLDNFPLRFG